MNINFLYRGDKSVGCVKLATHIVQFSGL